MRIVTRVLIFVLACIVSTTIVGQAPQFAVTRPDGTTFICHSFDSAYNKAISGDNIYMPGGTFLFTTSNINKRLNIFGAGHHPDSTNVTSRTIISNNSLVIDTGAAGGSMEGIYFSSNNTYSIYFESRPEKRLSGYTIKRCRFGGLGFSNLGGAISDSFATNVLVTECVLNQIAGNGAIGNSFIKNIIYLSINDFRSSSFKNNIYLYTGSSMVYTSNSTFENNIFLSPSPFGSLTCSGIFTNNLKYQGGSLTGSCSPSPGTESGTITVASVNDIFINYTPGSASLYSDNYHLKSGCLGINAGTDGTDVGIYGTSQPTNEGWVPSNPHIYFKQVAPQTNNSGQLQIQFKVRTND